MFINYIDVFKFDHCIDSFTEKSGRALLSSKKLINLGWSYRPLEETIVDTVKNYEEIKIEDKFKISIFFNSSKALQLSAW